MKGTGNVQFDGPIFEPGVMPRSVIYPAIGEALDMGYVYARHITPVQTGDLRAGWFKDYAQGAIINEVPYALFVDEGTRFMAPRDMSGKTTAKLHDLVVEAVLSRMNFVK